MKQSILGAVCLSLAAAIWGSMYVVSKYVLQYIPPLALVGLRYVTAVAILFIIILGQYWRTRQRVRITGKSWILLFLIGFIGYFASIVFQFIGTKLSDAHTASLITSATPAFIVVFARIVLREAVTVQKIVSLVMATIGVMITIGWPDTLGNYFWGGVILIGAAVTWALLSVFVKKASETLPSLTITAYAMLVALILTAPFTAIEWHEGLVHFQDRGVVAGVLFLGIVSTAGAFFLWNKGMELMDAGIGSLFFFFQPVVGTLLGWLMLGEHLSMNFFIGSVLIVAGVVAATVQWTRPSKFLRHERKSAER